MILLSELDDCKTCEQLIDLIHLDAEADDWDNDWLDDDDDEDEGYVPPQQSRADEDACTALMREALEYAALGDLDEAKLRVRNRFHPKWHSLNACQGQYNEAMGKSR